MYVFLPPLLPRAEMTEESRIIRIIRGWGVLICEPIIKTDNINTQGKHEDAVLFVSFRCPRGQVTLEKESFTWLNNNVPANAKAPYCPVGDH